MESMSEAQKKY
jgi:hypothetical protein